MHDAPGRGRKVTVTADADARVRVLLATPPPAARRWTVRSLATALGISRASVHRVLKAGKFTLAGNSDRSEQTDASGPPQSTNPNYPIN
jgi:hypothetical protein